MVRMSPKMPAVVMPIASATAMQPSGIASMAARVEIGLPQLSGVARSSRAGTKRMGKAGPTSRLPPGGSGIGPFSQPFRIPFLSSIVVMVAVVTRLSFSNNGFMSPSIAGDQRSGHRQQAEALVAAAQPVHERQRQQHHPGLADDLAEQEVKR